MKRAIITGFCLLALGACSSGDDSSADTTEAESTTTTEVVAEATTTTTGEPATTTTQRATTTTVFDAERWFSDNDDKALVDCLVGWDGSDAQAAGVDSIDFNRLCRDVVPTTTTTTTAPAPEKGTRTNPLDVSTGPLVSKGFSALSMYGPVLGDMGAILEANQFNDEPVAGTHYVVVGFNATVKPDETEPVSGNSLAFSCGLVGDKGKVYEEAFLSDVDGNLGLLSDQPDAIGGGTLVGDVYYAVDDDDDHFLLLCDDTFIRPAPV